MVIEARVEIRRTKPGISLIRLSWGDEHVIVCGGRLISRGKGGSVKGFRALGHGEPPKFTRDLFPCDFDDWVAGDHPEVQIEEWKCRRHDDGKDRYGMFPCGRIRAADKLFVEHEADAVIEWLGRWK